MVKEQVAQELKEKFKKGEFKPSQLKKSKSTGDLPATNPSLTQPRRKSINPVITEDTLKKQLQIAQDKIATLELKLEVQERELTELNNLTDENAHLKEQAGIKQKELESLRGELSEVNQELKDLKSEKSNLLDQNLTLKHQNLKDWFEEYSRRQKVEQELAENMDYASEELLAQDEKIANLQGQVVKLKQTNQSLIKDLDLTTKLAELRKVPYFENDSGLSYFKYGIYALLAVWFLMILRRKNV